MSCCVSDWPWSRAKEPEEQEARVLGATTGQRQGLSLHSLWRFLRLDRLEPDSLVTIVDHFCTGFTDRRLSEYGTSVAPAPRNEATNRQRDHHSNP